MRHIFGTRTKQKQQNFSIMNNTNNTTNSAAGYKLFNRHEVFTRSTHDTVWSIRRAVEDAEWAKDETVFGPVSNKIMGLFDGYLYDGLLEEVAVLGCSSEVCYDLNQVIKLIEEHLAAPVEDEAEVEDQLLDAIQDIDEGDLETCYFGRNSDEAYAELISKEISWPLQAKARRFEIDPVRLAYYITRENLKRAGVSI